MQQLMCLVPPKVKENSFTTQTSSFLKGQRSALQTDKIDVGEPKWLSSSVAHATFSIVFHTWGNQLYKKHNASGSNKREWFLFFFCNNTGSYRNCFINKACQLQTSKIRPCRVAASETQNMHCIQQRAVFLKYTIYFIYFIFIFLAHLSSSILFQGSGLC